MSTHTTPRAARVLRTLAATTALITATTLAVIAPADAATGTSAASLSTATSTSDGTVLTPSVVSLSSPELANPLRGQYRWIAAPPSPSTWPAPDLYDRDRTYWGRIEPSSGSFDWSTIDAGLKDAGDRRAKFGFRVMAYCPGCWMEQSWRKLPPITPPYVPTDSNGVPRWNDKAFQSAWSSLWSAVGARYGQDPRLGYVDVGGFGKYGEWMPAGDSLTTDSAKKIIAAVASNLPNTHVLLSAVTVYQMPAVLQWALDTYPNVGVRSDCLGNPLMQKPEGSFADVWKTRPFFTEWCTNGDPTTALSQVKNYHVSTVSSGNLSLSYSAMSSAQKADYEKLLKLSGYRYAVTQAAFSPVSPGRQFTLDLTLANAGTAPTYDAWTTRLVLFDGSGTRRATLPLPLDLRTVLPGTTTRSMTLTAPNLPDGTYRASVEVVDPARYSTPMRLANGSRAGDGSYPLGAVALRHSALPTNSVVRLAGSDRYATSAAISAATFSPGVSVAYVATGANFPDALSGAPAGGVEDGPVLLVRTDSVPAPTAAELARLAPRRIVILGGTGSVSGTVASALAAYTTGSVTRLSGPNRYATSAAISAATFSPGVPVAYVATGSNFPDALSGAPAGGVTGGPVLLVRPDLVPAPVASELTRLRPQRIVILGGTGSVSGTVASALAAYTTGSVTRLSGPNRYATSAAISAATFSPGVPVAYVATGATFPDALSGAPAGGVEGGPVLLVTADSIPDVIATELIRVRPQRIIVLGGSTTVSQSVWSALDAYVQPTS